MGEGSGKAREISLGEDFGDVAVNVNGVRVEVHTDGSILAYTNGPVQVHPAANDDVKSKAGATPEIGDKMEDGTVYAGISPDTNKPMYATPKDAPGVYDFNEAARYAKNLDANGHHDFHAPSKGELNVLFENRNKGKLKGTFNETGSYPAGWYWSSSPGNYGGWAQRFSDGHQYGHARYDGSSLRCVR